MKEFFASQAFGMTGLLLFFALFSGVLVWLFLPGAREKFKKHGNIPFKDEDDGR